MATNNSSLQESSNASLQTDNSGGSGSLASDGGSREEQGIAPSEQEGAFRARVMEVLNRPGQSDGSHPFVGAALLKNVDPGLYGLLKKLHGVRVAMELGFGLEKSFLQEKWVTYTDPLLRSSREDIVGDAEALLAEVRGDINQLKKSKRNEGSAQAEGRRAGEPRGGDEIRGDDEDNESGRDDSAEDYPGRKHDFAGESSDEERRENCYSVTSAMDLAPADTRELFNRAVAQAHSGNKSNEQGGGNPTLAHALSQKVMMRAVDDNACAALRAGFPNTLGPLTKKEIRKYLKKNPLCPGSNPSPGDQALYGAVGDIVRVTDALRCDNSTYLRLVHFVQHEDGNWNTAFQIMHNRALQHLGLTSGSKEWRTEVKEASTKCSDKGKSSGGASQNTGRQGRETRGGGRGGWSYGSRSGGYQHADRGSRDGGHRGRGHGYRNRDYEDRRGGRENRRSIRGRREDED